MDPLIIDGLFTFATAVAVAWVGYRAEREKRDRARATDEQRRRDEHRRELMCHIMSMTAADNDALLVICKKLHGDEVNGDMAEAIKRLTVERDEYSDLRDEIVAHI